MLTLFIAVYPLLLSAQQDTVAAGVYKWKDPVPGKDALTAAVLFQGSTTDLAFLQVTANRIVRTNNKMVLPHDVKESLLIIKSGALAISLNDSSWVLGKGSIALVMPGEQCLVQSAAKEPCEFYLMSYLSKSFFAKNNVAKHLNPAVVDWKKVVFTPHDKGGIRKFLEQPTDMLKRLEIHVSTLNAGIKSHEPHTHRAAEIILMLEGDTEMQIGEEFKQGVGGDVYFLSGNVLHAIRNKGVKPAIYFAIQFE